MRDAGLDVQRIETLEDPRVADYRGVRDPVRLTRDGVFLGEGRLVLELLLARPRYALRSVLLTPTARAWLESTDLAVPSGVPVFEVAGDVLAKDTGYRFHQGCLAAVEVPAPRSLASLTSTVATTPGPLVVLSGVTNPDNVGAIFRTAAAFRCAGVLLDDASASPLYRKCVRTSMGAVLRLPWRHAGTTMAQLGALREAGVEVLALTPDSAATSLLAWLPDAGASPRAVVLGAEGDGLPADVQAAADARIRIPMDPALDSLNVAAAAAVTLFALTMRR